MQIKDLISNKYFFIFDLWIISLVIFDQQFWSHQNYLPRIFLCLLIFVYLIYLFRLAIFSKSQLGLTTTNLFVSLQQSLFPATIFIVVLTTLRLLLPSLFSLGIYYDSITQVVHRLLAYVIFSVTTQELVFRGYFISRLEQFSQNKYFLIIFSALIFSAIHWPLKSPLLTIGSFIFGVYLAANFLKFRNIFLSMIIHALLGVLTTLYVMKLV